MIANSTGFMTDFLSALKDASKTPSNVIPAMWPHQQQMYDAGLEVMQDKESRVRIICATGGGKTRVICELIKSGFEQFNCSIQVIVAPNIALLCQHDVSAYQFNVFNNNVETLHFRTGADPRENGKNYREDVKVSTSASDLLNTINRCKAEGKNLMVFVTYASVENMFEIVKKHDIDVGATFWDEFHHTVRTDSAYRNFILTVPSKRNFFFSASSKSNRTMSSFNDNLYGKLGANITFSYLRNAGYLVNRIVLKILRLSQTKKRQKALSEKMKAEGEREGVDMDAAALEAASVIAARNNMLAEVGPF